MNHTKEIEEINNKLQFRVTEDSTREPYIDAYHDLLTVAKKMEKKLSEIKDKERAYGRDYYSRCKDEILRKRRERKYNLLNPPIERSF